jgi:aspartate kinase
VIKIGGSVITGVGAYQKVAVAIAARVQETPANRFVVVVSAEQGTTDRLLADARSLTSEPDPSTLDLLWSTGELRAVALLVLALHERGVRAVAANVHQTGLVDADAPGASGLTDFRSLRLRSLLANHDVVVAPGFLARGNGDSVVSLGRGGSDLTAVRLAAGLGADVCELVKDVPGYFSSDPGLDPDACHLPAIDYDTALDMAERGCELVQRRALEAAKEHRLAIVVRAITGTLKTVVTNNSVKEGAGNGVRDTDDSCGATLRAWHRGPHCAHLPDLDVRAGRAGRASGV